MEPVGLVNWQSAEFWLRFRNGDPATLEAVYWHFVDVVEHVLASGFLNRNGVGSVPGVRDPDVRADLLQEAFLKAFSASARQSFDARLDYRPYLLTIARNVLCDHYRRKNRDAEIRDPIDPFDPIDERTIPAPDDTDDPAWAAPSLLPVVERFVASLTSPLREIHNLRFVQGKSQRDAARIMGLSRQNMRTLEARLKDGLRAAVEEAQRSEEAVPVASEGRAGERRAAQARSR